MNKKNKTFAIPVAVEATPLKPNRPATIAMMRKISAHPNIMNSF